MIYWTFIVLSFVLGYVLGRVDSMVRMINLTENNHVSFLKRKHKQNEERSSFKKIEIDDTKFVTDVSTDDMASLGKSVGVVSKTADDISSATNKLAQLKKMKG